MNPEYEKHAIKIKEMVDMLCNKIENLEVCLEPQVVADFIELVASDNLGISSLASVEKLFEKLKNTDLFMERINEMNDFSFLTLVEMSCLFICRFMMKYYVISRNGAVPDNPATIASCRMIHEILRISVTEMSLDRISRESSSLEEAKETIAQVTNSLMSIFCVVDESLIKSINGEN